MKIEIINPKKSKNIICPKCNDRWRYAEYHEKKGDYWVIVRQCKYCRAEQEILTKKFLDVMQPSSQLWDLVYDDPFADYEKNKKDREWQEEKRKERLDAEYNLKFKRPWERKFVKDWVLGGKKSWLKK